MRDPTKRFSDRAGYYVKSRPGYPSQIVPWLAETCGLIPAWAVADIGSGTGIFTRLLLDHGNTVYAVEPNAEMRAAAEGLLSGRPGFISVAGTAEATTLAYRSVQMAVSAQAFHWFDRRKARVEFERILCPGGPVALIWNRRVAETPFQRAYEDLLKEFSTEYQFVGYDNISPADLNDFFSPGEFRTAEFDNFQDLDFEGLRGRLMSASYIPPESAPSYPPMIEKLTEIFRDTNDRGLVRLQYQTQVFLGRLITVTGYVIP